jgi:hypothetical protein
MAAGNFIKSFRAPRTPEEDANFARNFRIKERMNLQIRGEFVNIFNRTLLPSPITTNPQNAPAKNALGIYTSGFGISAPISRRTPHTRCRVNPRRSIPSPGRVRSSRGSRSSQFLPETDGGFSPLVKPGFSRRRCAAGVRPTVLIRRMRRRRQRQELRNRAPDSQPRPNRPIHTGG